MQTFHITETYYNVMRSCADSIAHIEHAYLHVESPSGKLSEQQLIMTVQT